MQKRNFSSKKMETKLKLCRELRTTVCSVNSLRKTNDAIDNLFFNKVYKNDNEESYKSSAFTNTIITCLLILNDDIYLDDIIWNDNKYLPNVIRGDISNDDETSKWYEIVGADSDTLRVMKKFLLNVYYDDDLESRMVGLRREYNHVALTFRNSKSKEKIAVFLRHPYPLMDEDKTSIIKGIHQGLMRIFPDGKISQIFYCAILLNNLVSIFGQKEIYLTPIED